MCRGPRYLLREKRSTKGNFLLLFIWCQQHLLRNTLFPDYLYWYDVTSCGQIGAPTAMKDKPKQFWHHKTPFSESYVTQEQSYFHTPLFFIINFIFINEPIVNHVDVVWRVWDNIHLPMPGTKKWKDFKKKLACLAIVMSVCLSFLFIVLVLYFLTLEHLHFQWQTLSLARSCLAQKSDPLSDIPGAKVNVRCWKKIYLGQMKLSCNIEEKNNLRQFGRCPSGKNENPENHSILQSKPIHVHPSLNLEGGELQKCYGSDFAGGNVSCYLVPVLTGYLSRQVMYWQYRDNPKDYLGENTFKIPNQSSAHKKASVILNSNESRCRCCGGIYRRKLSYLVTFPVFVLYSMWSLNLFRVIIAPINLQP